MAHFILEYSANLNRQTFDPVALLGALIDAAVATGAFPRAGCRGRAYVSNEYFVGDGRASFGFVHLQVRLGPGRSDAEKSAAQTALVAVLESYLAPAQAAQGLAVSCEMVELSQYRANINNLREYLENG